MKTVLAILSFVLVLAFTANAQTETNLQKEQTATTVEKSLTEDQATVSVNEEVKHKCEGKSKEECKKACDHEKHDEMSKKECKPGCEKECCAKNTEEVKETDGTSEKE